MDEGRHKSGDLVIIRHRSHYSAEPVVRHGVVVEYWRSNMYESASYEILSEGDIIHAKAQNVYPAR